MTRMTRWDKSRLMPCTLLVALLIAGRVDAELMTFNVIPAYAPQGPIAPSWDDYVERAILSIRLNVDSGDRATDPTAYERVAGTVVPEEMTYTAFNSWRGKAAPDPGFVGPFLGEFGNRVHFGLHMVSDPNSDFAMADLTWELDSDDLGGPNGTGYFDQAGDFVDLNYSATRVGINYGDDGLPGTGDEVLIASGPGTQRVHEFIYVGVGEGFFATAPGDTDQGKIDATMSAVRAGCGDPNGCWVNLMASYSLPSAAGAPVTASGSVRIFIIPEPTTSLLFGLGMVTAIAAVRRRRSPRA